MQQIIELFSIDAYGDKPLFWITLKTDGGDICAIVPADVAET